MPPGDWASYFWPGTTVLSNRLGLRDPDELEIHEYRYGAARQAELELGTVSIVPTYDAAHLRAIHRHLFQDVYDWAGEYRTVPLAKGISEFAPTNRISSYLDSAAAMVDNTAWSSLPAAEFADIMAKIYAWTNHAHPFREGNGRATKLWLASVAGQSSWRLDFERVEADVWNQAAALSGPDRGQLTPDPGTLIPVFTVMTTDRPARRSPAGHRFLTACAPSASDSAEPPQLHTDQPSTPGLPPDRGGGAEDQPHPAPGRPRSRYRQ